MCPQRVIWLIVLPLIVGLNACAAREEKAQENILPSDHKSVVLEMLQTSLDDPTNIRDAAISEPVLKPVAGSTRYVVCFRYNAKDGSGRYMGVKDTAAVFFAGRVTQYITPTSEQCGGVAYQPFPELQKLCRSIGCQGRY